MYYTIKLKCFVEEKCATKFKSVLANYYRDHNDSVGWHSDDEVELGIEPIIASLSFGSERVFNLKHKYNDQRFKLKLLSGSLLVMKGKTQSHWQHAVLKSRQQTNWRVNLTFRTIKNFTV